MLNKNYHCIIANRDGEEKFIQKKKSLNNIIFKLSGKMWLVFAFSKKRCGFIYFFSNFFISYIRNYVLNDTFPKKHNSHLINRC